MQRYIKKALHLAVNEIKGGTLVFDVGSICLKKSE